MIKLTDVQKTAERLRQWREAKATAGTVFEAVAVGVGVGMIILFFGDWL